MPSPPTSSSPSSSTRTFSGSLPVGGQQRLQRLHVHIHLPLVVDGAARIEIAVALCRLKRRREAIHPADRAAAHRSGRRPAPSACRPHAASPHTPADGRSVSISRTFSMPMRFRSAASISAALRQSPLCSGSVETDGIRSRPSAHRESAGGFGGQNQQQTKTSQHSSPRDRM